jgi:HSP20 family protein
MRYRRLRYSYTAVVPNRELQLLFNLWPRERSGMVLPDTCWRPPTDVYETRDAITVIAELAGGDDNDIEVLVYNNAVVIQGRRKLPSVDPEGVYLAAEIRQGPFRVEVSLPMPIESEQADVRYQHGLLRIILPKANEG